MKSFGRTNLIDFLLNHVIVSFLDDFVILFIDDILVYSQSIVEHEQHLRMVL